MKEIIRYMDRTISWETFAYLNQLIAKIEKVTLHNTVYEIIFSISFSRTAYSLIKLIFSTQDTDINPSDFLSLHTLTQKIHKTFPFFQECTLKQKLYMSYLNKEEAEFFKLSIGDPILYLRKEYQHASNICLIEEEVCLLNVYTFKERYTDE